jgi:hypothetical protein
VTKQLDDDWADVAALLQFKGRDEDKRLPEDALKDKMFDDVYTQLKTESGIKKIQPEAVVLTEKQKAQQRRAKLENLDKKAHEEDAPLKKREEKAQSKRERAIEEHVEKEILREKSKTKESKLHDEIEQRFKKKDGEQGDSDLQSSEEEEEGSQSGDDEEAEDGDS